MSGLIGVMYSVDGGASARCVLCVMSCAEVSCVVLCELIGYGVGVKILVAKLYS